MELLNRQTAEHYNWKEICDGWHFLKSDELSIIAEKMPPNTAEDPHYHTRSKQFFYVLSGEAVMKFKDESIRLTAGSAIIIGPQEVHQMTNQSDQETEFLVVSLPKSHGDRINAVL